MSEFDKDKQINPLELDMAATMQPELFYKWAKRAVKAKSELEAAKFRMDVMEANLQIKCRKSPEEFGLSKVTEASIISAVKLHPKFHEVFEEYIQAKKESMMLDKAVEAMEQRKRMIEVLITLHGQQYFAGPSVPRDLAKVWADQQERGMEILHDKQKKKLRKKKKRKQEE